MLICHSEIRRGVFVSQVCYATSSKGRGVWGQQHPTPRPPATWIPSQDFGHICLPTPASVSPSLSSPLSLYLSLHLSLSLSLFISISPSLCLYFSVSPSLSPVALLSFFVSAPSLCLCVSHIFPAEPFWSKDRHQLHPRKKAGGWGPQAPLRSVWDPPCSLVPQRLTSAFLHGSRSQVQGQSGPDCVELPCCHLGPGSGTDTAAAPRVGCGACFRKLFLCRVPPPTPAVQLRTEPLV